MYTCAVFGHRNYPYENLKMQIKDSLVDLIENYHVSQFYCGARGKFDWICAQCIYELKQQYPFLQCIHVWSYIPQKDEGQQIYFDASVYLLEKWVAPVYAIVETNKKMVDKADYILSGVMHGWGGACAAVEYAVKKEKKVISIFSEEK